MISNNKRLKIADLRQSLPLVGLVAIFLLSVPVAEANWQVSPELGAGVEYDDNMRLSNIPGLSESDTGYGIEAQAIFFYNRELTDFRITPRLRSKRFNDNSDLDSDDQFLRLDFSHEGQKSRFSLRGDYSSESVRTAERSDVDFDIDDPDEIPVDDTGRTLDAGNRDRLSLAPKFDYQLTQRTSLAIGGKYLDSSYDDDVSQILTGFSHYFGGGWLGYSWSEIDTVSLSAYVGKYEEDGSGTDSATRTFSIGYQREISERTQFRMSVGGDTSEDQFGEDQTNPVGEISITHRYATMRVIAAYQRSVSGGGDGLSVRDALSLNVSRDLTERFTLSGGVRAYATEALGSGNNNFVERDYLQLRARARWNLSRKLSVDLDYRYTEIDRDAVGVDTSKSDSNRIGLWFNWHPKPLRK